MASNRTVLDYINGRRSLESSLQHAHRHVERDLEQLEKSRKYLHHCLQRLTDHNASPPQLTEAQEARYGARVRGE